MNQQHPTLTTRQGHPVSNNQGLPSVGEWGAATPENSQFIEKITYFDRERIPKRVVHARGTGAHDYFEAYGKIGSEPWRSYDFVTPSPDALHRVSWGKNPWGIPASYREMEAWGHNIFKLVNEEGLASAQTADIQAQGWAMQPRICTKLSSAAISCNGELCIQIMRDGDPADLAFDPLDDTSAGRKTSSGSFQWAAYFWSAIPTIYAHRLNSLFSALAF